MDAIQTLKEIDFFMWIVTAFMILAAIIAGYEIITKFMAIIGKPIGAIKQRKEDHELVLRNAEALEELKKQHERDIKQSKNQENEISSLIENMSNEMKEFAQNRVNDRQQSFQIQKELIDSIKKISDANSAKEEQINNLMAAQREILANKINDKYKSYILLNGIPEDELDEFRNLHDAYKGCGGNSSGDAKFEYCMNHLEVIPVETKLIIKHEE